MIVRPTNINIDVGMTKSVEFCSRKRDGERVIQEEKNNKEKAKNNAMQTRLQRRQEEKKGIMRKEKK